MNGTGEEMPIPFGVVAATGETHPPLTEADLTGVPSAPKEAAKRSESGALLAVVPTVDPKDLNQAGWGILFASGIAAEVKTALAPLIEHRQRQISKAGRFKIFEGNKGVRPNQSAVDWLDRQGVSLALVDPRNGVPFYLLLVGSPAEISWEFQFVLDTQWNVGRVWFEQTSEYESWARSVVEYETASTMPHGKHVAMWMPRNQGDAATTMLANMVGRSFEKDKLGEEQGFRFTSRMGESATKANLQGLLEGKAEGGVPAVLFTGSHGLEWPMEDTAGQRAQQGALITQDWTPSTQVQAGQQFAGSDVAPSLRPLGMIHFMFACFGGGCPTVDTFRKDRDGNPIPIAAEPMVARLPQRLLASGALAVIAHVDRAWSWSFHSGSGLPQTQVMRSTIEAVLLGLRVGQALDFYNLQWSTLAALDGVQQGATRKQSAAARASLLVARDDARNYALLGDPAAQLRIDRI